MSLFRKRLVFHSSYWEFHNCINFTIQRGVVDNYEPNEKIVLVTNLDMLYRPKNAKIICTQTMKFCDIKSFKEWHCLKNKYSESPIDAMKYFYPKFDENEIVTLIWFKVLE